ncbi:MAG: protein-disulfide reductase DsbD N-terminal domain-containing protein [Acidobacteriia bacterium]|nr:protein-disulfide reductase DsbD N-terminal domain-containing protein [Terriglobia bacterium]
MRIDHARALSIVALLMAAGCTASSTQEMAEGDPATQTADTPAQLAESLLRGVSDSSRKVIARAGLTPSRLRPGQTATLVLALRIAPGWHIYAPGAAPAFALPTRLEIALPAGLESAPGWDLPKPHKPLDGEGLIYEDTLSIQRRLRITMRAPTGPGSLVCVIHYVVCDPFMCLPPETQSMPVRFDIVR